MLKFILLMSLTLISCSKETSGSKTIIVERLPEKTAYSAKVFAEPEMYISEHKLEGTSSFESEGLIISSLFDGEMTVMFYHYSDQGLNSDGSSKNILPAPTPEMKVQWSKYSMILNNNLISLSFLNSSCVTPAINPLVGQIGSSLEFKNSGELVEVATLGSSFNAKVMSKDEKDVLLNNINIKEVVCAGE